MNEAQMSPELRSVTKMIRAMHAEMEQCEHNFKFSVLQFIILLGTAVGELDRIVRSLKLTNHTRDQMVVAICEKAIFEVSNGSVAAAQAAIAHASGAAGELPQLISVLQNEFGARIVAVGDDGRPTVVPNLRAEGLN